MIAWLKIASRNLLKNRRRSFVTCVAIALGFSAVNLFGGFTQYMYAGNRESAIFGRAQGHLVIFKRGFLEKGKLDPARFLLTSEELEDIEEICLRERDVLLVTPQLYLSGLVTNGMVSTIFLGQGIVPSVMDRFTERTTIIKETLDRTLEGRKLKDDKVYGVGAARGLARLLDLKVGSNAVVFTNTVEGQMNALDIEVFQLFDMDSDLLDDKVLRVPFRFAQLLYDTEGADRVAVLLSKTESTDAVRHRLRVAFSQAGLKLDIKTWKEMSQWYRKVKSMFDTIFIFLFVIVFIVAVTSVVNTMSVAVLERTREIGTLRALGLKRRGVILLFAMESCLLGLSGTVGGLLLTLLSRGGVRLFEPTWVPPGITSRVPIRIELSPETMLYSFVFLLALCLFASLLPVRRAAHQNVVDALTHV